MFSGSAPAPTGAAYSAPRPPSCIDLRYVCNVPAGAETSCGMSGIAMADHDLFFHHRDSKEMSFYYFRDTKLCKTQKKQNVNSIYIVGIMFVR